MEETPFRSQRLDMFVIGQRPRLSRAFAAKLIEQGSVTVNGQPSKPGYKLREQDIVAIDYDEAALDAIPSIDLPILYEDDDCVVINKPAGVLTHARGNLASEASVATFLRERLANDLRAQAGTPTEARAGIVHRLDRATSGVMICAKNQTALSWLQKQFSQRRVQKTYVAIVRGALEPSEAVIDMPIERNPKAPARFRVGASGKTAVTHYKTLASSGHFSLLELKPETGRTHQLRVHLAHLGHAIIGDPLYGDGKFEDRLFLHALSLEITLPNRERRVFTAPLPPEFNEQMQA